MTSRNAVHHCMYRFDFLRRRLTGMGDMGRFLPVESVWGCVTRGVIFWVCVEGRPGMGPTLGASGGGCTSRDRGGITLPSRYLGFCRGCGGMRFMVASALRCDVFPWLVPV